jgi:SAM-dependent methyltransferase
MAAAYSLGIAPYLAQFMRPAEETESLCAAVAALGGGLRIVDLGAGLGASSLALAEAGHQLIAVEPDAEMAAVIGARLAAAPLLRERMALLSDSRALAAGEAELVICQSVLHLLATRDEQIELLREAVRLLAPDGQLWLELPLPSTQRRALPWQLLREQQLGTTCVQLHREMHGLADGGWQTDWRFEIRQGDRLLQQIERSYRWQLMAEADLRALAAAAGLVLQRIGADWAASESYDAERHSYGYPRLHVAAA